MLTINLTRAKERTASLYLQIPERTASYMYSTYNNNHYLHNFKINYNQRHPVIHITKSIELFFSKQLLHQSCMLMCETRFPAS